MLVSDGARMQPDLHLMKWHRQLHWQIIVALILGIIFGVIAAKAGWRGFVADWIAPWGEIFLRLLKLIAVPLVLTSLVMGVSSLSDVKKLSRMGGKTIGIYVATTAVAVIIGLLMVNIVKPGDKLDPQTRADLSAQYADDEGLKSKAATAAAVKKRPALQPLVDMIPDNFFMSAASNRNMLQMVFFAILAGVALVRLHSDRSKPVIDVVSGFNEIVIEMVKLIMKIAPLGVFDLIADAITEIAKDDPSQVVSLIKSLGFYAACVVGGLFAHMCLVYLVLLKAFTPFSIKQFLQGIAPAQLLAFSTSSSGATLPVTMKRCEESLGVSKEVSSFVLPLGATINMDGTALYQAVAAVFIAQATGMELTMGHQVTIVLTAVLASIGTAAVPGAGMVMLIVILEAIGAPGAGIALIAGVDRILDMLRTVTNVTGDATVTSIIATSEKQLVEPPAAAI